MEAIPACWDPAFMGEKEKKGMISERATHAAHHGISRQAATIHLRIIGKLVQNPTNMRAEESLRRVMGHLPDRRAHGV